MTQQATIRGEVSYRVGDGVLMPIPDGPVSIDVADDSVTLGWEEGKGNAVSTAITRDEYDRYVKEGKIRVADEG
ncbi:MAG TPA: hypothetical protein VIL30_17345 [Ramlibacter sp.]|jgi:hypothetical protein